MENFFTRQDHVEAIELNKASYYCYKRESKMKYLMISLSILFVIAGIFLKFTPEISRILKLAPLEPVIENGKATSEMFYNTSKIEKVTKTLSASLGFASGIWVIIQMYLSYRANIYHKEAVTIEEKYDNYVFKLEPNKIIMRPINNAMISSYANRINKNDLHFQKKYFKVYENKKDLIFHHQKYLFYFDYHLMIYAKAKFFNYIWFLFFIVIFVFALMINTTFLDALTSIFFPSLGAISLIVSSMISHNVTFKYLQNSLNCIEAYENDPEERLSSPALNRNMQDALFIYRLSSFMVPKFIINSYNRKIKKDEARKLKLLAHSDFQESTIEKNKKSGTRKSSVITASNASATAKINAVPKKDKKEEKVVTAKKAEIKSNKKEVKNNKKDVKKDKSGNELIKKVKK